VGCWRKREGHFCSVGCSYFFRLSGSCVIARLNLKHVTMFNSEKYVACLFFFSGDHSAYLVRTILNHISSLYTQKYKRKRLLDWERRSTDSFDPCRRCSRVLPHHGSGTCNEMSKKSRTDGLTHSNPDSWLAPDMKPESKLT